MPPLGTRIESRARDESAELWPLPASGRAALAPVSASTVSWPWNRGCDRVATTATPARGWLAVAYQISTTPGLSLAEVARRQLRPPPATAVTAWPWGGPSLATTASRTSGARWVVSGEVARRPPSVRTSPVTVASTATSAGAVPARLPTAWKSRDCRTECVARRATAITGITPMTVVRDLQGLRPGPDGPRRGWVRCSWCCKVLAALLLAGWPI